MTVICSYFTLMPLIGQHHYSFLKRPAGAALNIDAGRTAMAIAWGDQWTNMVQPFWALPALGIAKLSARDIMGYLVIVLLFTGVVACLGFLAWAMFF